MMSCYPQAATQTNECLAVLRIRGTVISSLQDRCYRGKVYFVRCYVCNLRFKVFL